MSIVAAGHVTEFVSLSKEGKGKITNPDKFELTLYFLAVTMLGLIHYLVAKVPVIPAHILMKIVVAYSLIFCVLKAQLFDIYTDHFPYDGYLIFYFFALTIIAVRMELVYIAFIFLVVIFGFYAHDLVRFSEFRPEEIKQREVYI